MDVLIANDGATATVTGETDDGEAFVDAWLLGVLSVQDVGRVTVTSEVIEDFTKAAGEKGLQVELV